jgi:hypothetical protein
MKLYNAIGYNEEDMVNQPYPSTAADYDEPGCIGCSLLMYAAFNGLEDVVKRLLQPGADINRRGYCSEVGASGGQTALVLATFHSHANIVCELLQHPSIQITGSIVLQKEAITPHLLNHASSHLYDVLDVVHLRGFPDISQLFNGHTVTQSY